MKTQEGVSRKGGPDPVRAGPGVAPQAGPAQAGEVSMMTVDDVELRPFAGFVSRLMLLTGLLVPEPSSSTSRRRPRPEPCDICIHEEHN